MDPKIDTFGQVDIRFLAILKVENNAQTLPEQLHNNFEKVQKTIFSSPKMAKSCMSTLPKLSIFGSIFGLRALFLADWYWKKIKIVPHDSLRHLKKKKKKNLDVFPKKKNQKGTYAHPTTDPTTQ